MSKNTSEQLYRFKTFDGKILSLTTQELYIEFMSDNYIKACKIYNSWKQSLIEDLLNKNKVRFTCLNKKSLFKKFERILIKDLGKKEFIEYVKENRLQQDNFFQYAKVATNI